MGCSGLLLVAVVFEKLFPFRLTWPLLLSLRIVEAASV